jgi:ankyrin repeat protein
LRWAAELGHLDVAKSLVESGANIHAYDDYALCMAAESGHIDVVKYLKLVKNLQKIQL